MLNSEPNNIFELGRSCTHHVNHACNSVDVPTTMPSAGKVIYSQKCL